MKSWMVCTSMVSPGMYFAVHTWRGVALSLSPEGDAFLAVYPLLPLFHPPLEAVWEGWRDWGKGGGLAVGWVGGSLGGAGLQRSAIRLLIVLIRPHTAPGLISRRHSPPHLLHSPTPTCLDSPTPTPLHLPPLCTLPYSFINFRQNLKQSLITKQ